MRSRRQLRFINMEQIISEMRKLDMQTSIADLPQEYLIDAFLTSIPVDRYGDFIIETRMRDPRVPEEVLQAALIWEIYLSKNFKHNNRVGRHQKSRNTGLRPVHGPPKPPSGGGGFR